MTRLDIWASTAKKPSKNLITRKPQKPIDTWNMSHLETCTVITPPPQEPKPWTIHNSSCVFSIE